MRLAMVCVLFGMSALSGCQMFDEGVRDPFAARKIEGSWCLLGTSITWYCDHVGSARGGFTKGYDAYVQTVLTFTNVVNCAVNGGCVADQAGKLARADYYTIEHGVDDWANAVRVGTIEDYRGDARNGTFFANYRQLVNRIRELNPAARIIVCTPRRAFGYGSYLPPAPNLPVDGVKLQDFAEAVLAIAEEEQFPVADFYNLCGLTERQLVETSMDVAFHPNNRGHAQLATELLRAFARVD